MNTPRVFVNNNLGQGGNSINTIGAELPKPLDDCNDCRRMILALLAMTLASCSNVEHVPESHNAPGGPDAMIDGETDTSNMADATMNDTGNNTDADMPQGDIPDVTEDTDADMPQGDATDATLSDRDNDGVTDENDVCPDNPLYQDSPAGYNYNSQDPACTHPLGENNDPGNICGGQDGLLQIDTAYILPGPDGPELWFTLYNNLGLEASAPCVTRLTIAFEDNGITRSPILDEGRNWGAGRVFTINMSRTLDNFDLSLETAMTFRISVNGESITDQAVIVGEEGL